MIEAFGPISMLLFDCCICYALVMFAMCFDNLFWISRSPEFEAFLSWSIREKAKYIYRNRILTVMTCWRDIVPALTTGLLLAFVFRFPFWG